MNKMQLIFLLMSSIGDYINTRHKWNELETPSNKDYEDAIMLLYTIASIVSEPEIIEILTTELDNMISEMEINNNILQ